MTEIVEKLRAFPGALLGKGSTNEQIKDAELQLNVSFADEYAAYLEAFSIAALDGQEITGITKSERVNVVSVTKCQRVYFPEVNHTWYVIEETNIDGIVIWQDSTGMIYQTSPGMDAVKIADSLEEYLNL